MQTNEHQAVVLHTRSYQENSLLVSLWLRDIGKVSGIVRGVRGKKKPNLCQPFVLLDTALKQPRSNDGLVQVQRLEQTRVFHSGTYLSHLARLYLNELAYRILPQDHHDSNLFDQYLVAMEQLVNDAVERPLRFFELQFLKSLGYSFQCDVDEAGDPVEWDAWYAMSPLSAFYKARHQEGIKGEMIQKLYQDIHLWSNQELRQIHQLLRMNLDACLHGRPLKTRALLKEYLEKKRGMFS